MKNLMLKTKELQGRSSSLETTKFPVPGAVCDLSWLLSRRKILSNAIPGTMGDCMHLEQQTLAAISGLGPGDLGGVCGFLH
jgi:hypothetical protein